MQTYELIVQGRAVYANCPDTTLVRTSVGIDQIHVLFDSSEWTGFPIKVSFGNGSTVITQSLTVTSLDGGDWVAEGTCTIPWEVIQTLGVIRVTFQGTDNSGNHIITAAGSPLSVVEAGDVPDGTVPESAPTQSEWEQAYADAMTAINELQTAVENANTAVTNANAALAAAQAGTIPPATVSTIGGVIPDGSTVTVDADGTIHSVSGYELPTATSSTLGGVRPDNSTLETDSSGVISLKLAFQNVINNLQSFAGQAYDSTFSNGTLTDISPKVRTYRGTCSTTASTAAKVVSCTGFSLKKGVTLAIYMSAANSVEDAITFNVNSTGAKPVYKANAVTSSSNSLPWSSGETLLFMYDGDYWRYLGSDTAASGFELPEARAKYGSIPLTTSFTAASTAAKETGTLSGFELFAGARVSILFTYGNTNAGALTLNVNSTGAKSIYAGGAVTSASNPVEWSDGAVCDFIYDGTQWHYLGSSVDGYACAEAEQAIADNAAAISTLRDSVVKSATVSGTTSDTGSIVLTLKKSEVSILSAIATSDVWAMVIPWAHPYYQEWRLKFMSNIDGASKVNMSVTATIFYVNK